MIGLVGDDLAKVEQEPFLLLSDLWVMGIVGYIDGVVWAADTILEDLNAPPTAARIHEAVEQMARNIKVDMGLMEEGIENADMNTLVVAAFNMNDTSSEARYIRFLLNSFCE